ncbi:hypothetical protein BJY01DRAFT_46872 [Aspergillus pseudoustus]|uniref:Uncharacterized protein n=1 Tax=Aspergillus pseudoustus TaxID=1810923 RepID=A0ABR4JB60_9EURO
MRRITRPIVSHHACLQIIGSADDAPASQHKGQQSFPPLALMLMIVFIPDRCSTAQKASHNAEAGGASCFTRLRARIKGARSTSRQGRARPPWSRVTAFPFPGRRLKKARFTASISSSKQVKPPRLPRLPVPLLVLSFQHQPGTYGTKPSTGYQTTGRRFCCE